MMNVNQWITLFIAVLAITTLMTGLLVIINKKRTKTDNKTQTPGTPAVKTPQKLWFLKLWLVVFIISVIGVWWFTNYHNSDKTSSGIRTTQPNEEWVFIWSLPPNQYDRGRNSDTLEARIVKNDSESLWFDTLYTYGGSKEVGRNQLNKQGKKLVGSWCQDNPRDGGSIYMDKAGDQMWVGQLTDQTGRTYPCRLQRK